MGTAPRPPSSATDLFLLLLVFSARGFFPICWGGAAQADAGGGSTIVFTTLGRSSYTFDVFSLPVPPLGSSSVPLSSVLVGSDLELIKLTDGRSVNFNGFFPAGDPSRLLSLLSAAPPPVDGQQSLEALVYVSERNGSSNVYLDVYPSSPLAAAEGGRVQIPLLLRPDGDDGRVSMKDRPSVAGEHLIHVSTHEDSGAPRKSWAAVYSTHLPTGDTRRLTPGAVADISPAVSPSGEWTAVASSGERGWTGEAQELLTDIYVFRTRDGSERRKVVDHGDWPTWADESTLFFHRKCDDGWWSVFRAVLREGRPSEATVERVTPPGFHAFTPAAGRGFVAMATRRPTSEFRHIELLDLARNVFVEMSKPVSPDFHHFNPFVSPDSTRIGYHRCRGGGAGNGGPPLMLESIRSPLPEISLFRIDGSFPSFSPEGDRIAFVGLPGLFVMNSDGSERRQILPGNAFPTAWDRKRKGVIYTSIGPDFASASTEVDVVSVTVTGRETEATEPTSALPLVRKLTVGGENNAFPSPSPDGKWVVFRSGRSGHKNLYIMDAVEGEKAALRRLTDGPWTDTMCSWSPDGEWIAFSSDRDEPGGGGFALYLVHPNGTGLRRVFHSGAGGRVNHASFSPDSRQIVFTSDYAAVSAEPISNPHSYQPYGEIFTAGIDGSGVRRLTHNSFEDGTPAWSPTYMVPGDVAEASSPCDFEDCHWLEQGAASRLASGSDHPRCAENLSS